MSRTHIDHRDLVRFAEDKVNLPKDKADEYRAQARRLREKLEGYLSEHPDFSLKRIQLSGSLAKGTALRSLNDIDMAVYVSGSDAPYDTRALLDYLAERLRKAFPNFSPDQVKPQTYSVTVSFRGTGLDVDVVPVLYAGLPDWRGDLISQDDGSFLETSIPLHLDFAKKRKEAQPNHFAQVVRLVKFWARRMKQERDGFRFKSFMIEMILAKLCDDGVDFSDYPEGCSRSSPTWRSPASANALSLRITTRRRASPSSTTQSRSSTRSMRATTWRGCTPPRTPMRSWRPLWMLAMPSTLLWQHRTRS